MQVPAAAQSSPLAQPENPDQTNSIPITISLLTKLGDESVLKIVVSISLFLCRNQFSVLFASWAAAWEGSTILATAQSL